MTSQPQPHNPFGLVPVKKDGRSRNHEERNTKMFEAVIRGETLEAAGNLGGVTGTRAQHVIRKMCRMMLHPIRLGPGVMPNHDYLHVAELRRHADFWLAQLTKWKAERKIP